MPFTRVAQISSTSIGPGVLRYCLARGRAQRLRGRLRFLPPWFLAGFIHQLVLYLEAWILNRSLLGSLYNVCESHRINNVHAIVTFTRYARIVCCANHALLAGKYRYLAQLVAPCELTMVVWAHGDLSCPILFLVLKELKPWCCAQSLDPSLRAICISGREPSIYWVCVKAVFLICPYQAHQGGIYSWDASWTLWDRVRWDYVYLILQHCRQRISFHKFALVAKEAPAASLSFDLIQAKCVFACSRVERMLEGKKGILLCEVLERNLELLCQQQGCFLSTWLLSSISIY